MSLRFSLLTITIALPLGLGLVACGEDHGHGEPTGSTCPTGSTLTYDNFAKGFADKYCTRCHASTRTGTERHGAPLNHDFDTEKGILDVADHVDEMAAGGPDSINTVMPPSSPKPTEAERKQLGEYLACKTQ